MAQSSKAMKEAFVSGLSGGTIAEVNTITTVAPAAILLWAVLQSRHNFFEHASFAANFADFLLNVGGILLATTLYSSSPFILLGNLVASSILFLFLPPRGPVTSNSVRTDGRRTDATKASSDLGPFPSRPFLSYYRGTMMVVTCSSILAVDFHVFPRRFAKVETWGTSLMDLGVGSFVFSAGLVAAKAPLKDRLSNGPARTSAIRAVASIRAALPLLVLGIARLLSVKNLEYAEHVSEYGIHWNFFFTIAVVPLALGFLQPAIEALPGPRYAIAGLALTGLHQVALSCTQLQAWALTAPRDNLLAANREGITSTPGYLAIFVLGMSAGTLTLPRDPDSSAGVRKLLNATGLAPSTKSSKGAKGPSAAATTLQSADLLRTRLILTLFGASLLYSSGLYILSNPDFLRILTTPISRRLANLPYVLWISAFNTAQIGAFALLETLFFPSARRARSTAAEKEAARRATPAVLQAFNDGGLLMFLAANLLTGAVNLSVDTLNTGPYAATGIVAAYMGVLTLLAFNLRGVKLKL